MTLPKEKTLRNTVNYINTKSTHNTKSPRSEYRFFHRLGFAHDAAHFYPALVELTTRLLSRGQPAAQISHDLSQLVRVSGFSHAVAPVVHELAMRGAA